MTSLYQHKSSKHCKSGMGPIPIYCHMIDLPSRPLKLNMSSGNSQWTGSSKMKIKPEIQTAFYEQQTAFFCVG